MGNNMAGQQFRALGLKLTANSGFVRSNGRRQVYYGLNSIFRCFRSTFVIYLFILSNNPHEKCQKYGATLHAQFLPQTRLTSFAHTTSWRTCGTSAVGAPTHFRHFSRIFAPKIENTSRISLFRPFYRFCRYEFFTTDKISFRLQRIALQYGLTANGFNKWLRCVCLPDS